MKKIFFLVFSIGTSGVFAAFDCKSYEKKLSDYFVSVYRQTRDDAWMARELPKINELLASYDQVQLCHDDIVKRSLHQRLIDTMEDRMKYIQAQLSDPKLANDKKTKYENEYSVLIGKSDDSNFPWGNFKSKSCKEDCFSKVKFPVRFKNDADKCASKVVRNQFMNTNNVRDQDTIFACQSFAAADLLTTYYKKRVSAMALYRPHELTSDGYVNVSVRVPVHSSLRGANEKVGGTGVAIVANEAIATGRLCLEAAVPSSDFSFCQSNYNGSNYYKLLKDLPALIDDPHLNKDPDQCLASTISDAFPNIALAEIKRIILANPQTYIEKIHESLCKGAGGFAVDPKEVRVRDIPLQGVQNSFTTNLISSEVDDGHAVAIDVSSEVLARGGSNNVRGLHSMLVMGKKFQNGRCEYLVRNSFGNDCSFADGSNVKCEYKCETINNVQDCKRPSGHYWVSEDRLLESLKAISVVEKIRPIR